MKINGTRYYVADAIVAIATLSLCVGLAIGSLL